jgi:hypothetical protein
MALKAGNTTCSMIFRGQDVDCGWTETFQSSIVDLTAAAAALEAVARKRVGFLSARYSIDYLRTSKVQAPLVFPARNQRVSYLQRTDLGGSLDPVGDGDLPFCAALVRFYNTDKTVFGLREFRGIPDNFWKNNDDKDAQTRLRAPINAFVTALTANNMGMNHKLVGGGVVLTLIALGVFERLTHRATGRPLYLSRGRRSNRT